MRRLYFIACFSLGLFTFIFMMCQWLQFCMMKIEFEERDIETEQQIVKQKSSNRANHAKYYIDNIVEMHQLFLANEKQNIKKPKPDIAITIITASRVKSKVDPYQPRYLSQVVWKLFQLLYEKRILARTESMLNMDISICNIDAQPSMHEESQTLSKTVQTWQRFVSDEVSKKLSTASGWLAQQDALFEKEKQDYVFCLNKTLENSAAKYILLLEDDALPRDEFVDTLETVVLYHLSRSGRPVAWVKLYHPVRLLGFISLEVERIPELVGIGFVFGTLLAVVCIRTLKVREEEQRAVLAACCVCVVAVSLIVGRQHLVQLRRLLPPRLSWYGPAPDCCTPAMLYPRASARDVIAYLSDVTCKKGYGIDTALDHFIRQHPRDPHGHLYVRRMVQPNVVRHIGMYSTLRSKVLDPSIIDE